MSAESNENADNSQEPGNPNKNEDESKTNDIDNTTNTNNDKETNKNKKKNDDDKNIHVPKDKKLKIEYVSVKNAFVHNDVVFYDIHVKTSQHYWHVTKRYSQFEDLHNQLLQISKEKLPLIPAKHYKWFTDHTKPSFIEKRRALLDNYVKKLIKAKGVSSSQCVVNFFHNDKQAEEVIEKRKIQQEKLRQQQQDKHNDDNNQNGDDNEGGNNNMNEEENDNDNDDDDEVKINGAHVHRQSDEYDFPQDQEVTNIVIQSTRKMTDHVLYQICVSNSHKRASFRAWTVLKRFTQFYEMDLKLRAGLQTENPDLLPKLPPAPSRKFKFVHDHMDDDFIEERRVLLENYLSKLLRFPEVVRNEDFLEFLGVEL